MYHGMKIWCYHFDFLGGYQILVTKTLEEIKKAKKKIEVQYLTQIAQP